MFDRVRTERLVIIKPILSCYLHLLSRFLFLAHDGSLGLRAKGRVYRGWKPRIPFTLLALRYWNCSDEKQSVEGKRNDLDEQLGEGVGKEFNRKHRGGDSNQECIARQNSSSTSAITLILNTRMGRLGGSPS